MDKNDKEREQQTDDNASEEIRVTDRRRIHLSENGKTAASSAAETPNLKPSYVEELEARTRAAEKMVNEVQLRFEQLRNDLQREMDQSRERINRAANERAQREKEDFIAALLPVLDNLKRATEAAETGGSLEVIAEGIKQTVASFENALALTGVTPIQSVGEPFDPELHEAVDVVEVEPELDRKVIAEHAKGYKVGDRLLRPARVRVGHAVENLSQTADEF